MSKVEELQKLDRIIKDGEIRLRTVRINIESLSKEIDTLITLEERLRENIKCLKENRIVAMATEFKKAKEDLAKTKTRMISLQNDREHFRKSCDSVELAMKKAEEDIEKLKNGENNVLQFKSRKRNGRQG